MSSSKLKIFVIVTGMEADGETQPLTVTVAL
jgi:hypothetical protein